MLALIQFTTIAVLGVAVGVFSAGLGLGGGVLMMPAFITFLPNMDVHTARGTSLFVILLVALLSFPRVRHLQQVRPPLRPALFLSAGALAGSYCGATITANLSENLTLFLFLALVVALFVQMLFPTMRHRIQINTAGTERLAYVCIGSLAGVIGSATGTGGGTVLAPAMLATGLLSHTKLVYVSNQVMIATSLATVPVHLFAEQRYHQFWTIGQIAVGIAPLLVLFSLVGIYWGAKLNLSLKEQPRRLLLALTLAFVATRMALQLLRNVL